MKSRVTPVKYLKPEDVSRRRDRSPGQSAISVLRRQPPEFNPTLYINSRFNQEDIVAIKEAFDTYDSNHTGLLTPNDLKVALHHQGFHASKETVYNIIAQYDEDCLGGLNFQAFIKIISSEPSESESDNEIRRVFRKMDRDNKGYLDRKDLINLLKSLGDQWEADQLDGILQKLDQNSGNKITYELFRKIVHSPNSLY